MNQAQLPPILASGLCDNCVYKQTIVTDRQSVFLRCGRSATDATFPKYPRLPVVECSGWQKDLSALLGSPFRA